MVQLNCMITARASLPRITLTKIKDSEMFLLVVTVITMLFFIDSFSPSEQRCHWTILVGIRVNIFKFDANYGLNLSIP